MDSVIAIPLPAQAAGGEAPVGQHAAAVPPSPFVVGPENRLAAVAIRAVLDNPIPRGPAAGYSPVVFYGPTGTGKSHVAVGLAEAYRARYPDRSVECLAAVDFARRLIDAIETQDIEPFRRRHREADLLVLEDVVRLAGKEAAERELISTLDAVEQAGRWVVVSATSAPGQWPRMLPRLQSRLAGGLTVPLAPPGPEARLVLLRQLAAERQIELGDAAARLLVNGLDLSVRELVGAVRGFEFQRESGGGPIGTDAARQYLAERSGSRRPELGEIAAATARVFSLRITQLRGRSQSRAVVTARGVAMHLARQLTENSLQEIGRYFGGRDHSTVSHGCRTTKTLMKTDPSVRQAVQRVRDKLLNV
jgi:chromosomal replication initiator protein